MKKLLFLSFIIPMLASNLVLAQEKQDTKEASSKKTVDPFGLAKEKRESAEMPTPFGLIGSFTFGALKSSIAAHQYNISAYYDNYQISYRNLAAGVPVFELVSRTNNRDSYKGFGVQYGSYTLEYKNSSYYDDVLQETIYDSVRNIDMTYWGVTYSAWSNYTNEVGPVYGWDVSLGYSSGIHPKSKKAIEDGNIMVGGGGGWRIPMGTSAITLGIKYWAGASPRLSKDASDDFGKSFLYGIGVFTNIGLGFDK